MELRNLDLKFGTWNFENWAMKFWSWNLRLKFLKTYDLNLKFGNESFELKIWILKDPWKLWKIFFFLGWLSFWLSFKCGGQNFGPPLLCLFSFPFLLHLPSTSLPPLALFTFFFPLIFVLHLSISSHKKHFSKLLDLPLSISINISLDPCVLSTFIIYPFLVKPIF